MKNIFDLSIVELADSLKKGEYTAEQVCKECINNINANKNLNALISVSEEVILNQAKESDKRIKDGTARELEGVPVIIKDNISTLEYKTTCASKFLSNYVAPYEATVVKKLKDAGCIILAKSNMDEFAMGSSGENSAYGRTLNPVNNEYVPGGSSSGSAVAVKSNMCFASLGTETGGSVRQPAGFCDVVGIKPTYGRVSRYGVVAFASSFDQVGPFAKNVKDCAKILDVISGEDSFDGTTENKPHKPFSESFVDSIKGYKIGIVKEFFELGMNKEVLDAVNRTIEFYKSNGAEVVDVSLPNISKSLAVYYILTSAEVASNLSRYDGIKYGLRADKYEDLVDLYYKSRTEGFGKEVKRRIMIGNYCLSSGYFDAYYKKASEVRELIKKEFGAVFEKVDAIICPVSPTPPFKFGAKSSPLDMYLADIFTVPANLAGNCAISFNVGRSEEGLPIGCQLIADKWQEEKLFALAEYYERLNKGEDK